ncbi:MAG: T9SS type A sorting domain-containing protein, partial [Lewinella sp.]
SSDILTLPEGNYEVKLTAISGSGLGNIDYMEILAFGDSPVEALSCDMLNKTNAPYGMENAVNVYPVPASGIVNLEMQNADTRITRLTLYGYTGNRLLTRAYAANKVELDVSGLQAGAYMVELETDSGMMYLKRFVVN